MLKPETREQVQETEFSRNIFANDLSADQFTTSLTGERNDSVENNGGASEDATRYGSVPLPSAVTVRVEPVERETSGAIRALAPDLLRGLLMVLQSVDHSAFILGAWSHGLAIKTEGDGIIVDKWNHPTAWTARMLTHLCAPGFTFLLGMGVVYFGRSRSKLGWTTGQMIWHFAVRAFALAMVNEIFLTLLLARGQLWLLNIVLLALAVDYLLAGLIWLCINFSEKLLARILTRFIGIRTANVESQPLLDGQSHQNQIDTRSRSSIAESISWHCHNLVLLALTVVSISWNIWLSRDQGHCLDQDSYLSGGEFSLTSTSERGTFFDFWFYPTSTAKIQSPFPPLGWLTFAILGILYGRIVLARSWSPKAISLGNMLAGLLLLSIFVLTRLFHFGNLSEDCLQMPEQRAHPNRNQYLASFRSFLYVVKYPPSAAFFALTMAFNFFFLAFFGAIPSRYAVRIPGLMVFGTSALFFYITHLALYGALAIPIKMWFGHDLDDTDPMTGEPASGIGNTPVYWLTWILGMAILYPLCRFYSRFKSTKGPNSVWRFF